MIPLAGWPTPCSRSSAHLGDAGLHQGLNKEQQMCSHASTGPRIVEHEIPILDTAKFAAIVGIGPKFGYNSVQPLGANVMSRSAVC